MYLLFPHTLALLGIITSTHLRLQASLPVLSRGNTVTGASAQVLVLDVHSYSALLLQFK